MINEKDILMEKMRLLNRFSDAIEEARQAFVKQPSYTTAQRIQNLRKQREAIRRTLPKLREVA